MVGEKAFRRRMIVLALIPVAMMIAGSLLLLTGRPDGAESVAAPRSGIDGEAAAPASPAGDLPGPGSVRYPNDETGAAAAAVDYASAPQDWLYLDDDQIAAAVAEIASPSAVGRLTDEVLADVGAARTGLGASPGRVWWLVRPLAWRVEQVSVSEATVAVWVVTVLSAQEVAAPQAEWVTVTVELAWIDGTWRVDAVRDTPGPTPMVGPDDEPWQALHFDEALDGFTRIDGSSQ